jgi:transcription antitermination factor NusA-like protein
MYGLVHDAIEKLVIAKFGVATWNEIKIKAMLGDNELSETYSDEKTLDIVGAAVGVLGLDVEVIVETLGGFFISYVRYCTSPQ